ncbi:MAG TPA: XRE family transcriptional regulator [Anaerohalosphaeraceae bacterium]|nr:XRE family transcriptional regulator [Anaerohalosphaeraceae bacterium]
MSLADRLKLARKNVGLTLKQVAEKTGIDDSCLSAYENGQSEPRLSQLSKLAEVYQVSLSFFFEEDVSEQHVVLWRNKPANEKAIQARFLKLCHQYSQLEIWSGEKAMRQLPSLDDFGEKFGYTEAALLADRIREEMGLGKYPGKGLYSVLEEVYGVKIFHLDLGNLGTAACAKSSLFGYAILLNQKNCQWRRNHDLAHELFHLLTWERFNHHEGICEPSEKEEKLATCFAANLLLPETPVREAISKSANEDCMISLSRLDSIARQFDVSLESLFWRMHFLYGWEEKQTKKFIAEAKEYSQKTIRPDGSNPSLYPERYRMLAIRVFRKGEISLRRFAEMMNISRKEAEQYLDKDVDYEIPTPAA